METVRINEYTYKGMRINLIESQLTLLYNYAVTIRYSFFSGVIFGMDSIIVDYDVLNEIHDTFEHLELIVPIKLNRDYYDWVRNERQNRP